MASSFESAFAEAARVYAHFATVFGGGPRRRRLETAEKPGSHAFEAGRDPRRIGTIFRKHATEHGWGPFLSRVSIIEDWVDVVGADVALHTEPTLEDGVLTVACDSSAWATQLRVLRHDIRRTIDNQYPDSGVDRIVIVGPGVPQKILGPRRVKWRGPRDTYG